MATMEQPEEYTKGFMAGYDSCLRRINSMLDKDIDVLKRYAVELQQVNTLEIIQDELTKFDPKEFF